MLIVHDLSTTTLFKNCIKRQVVHLFWLLL